MCVHIYKEKVHKSHKIYFKRSLIIPCFLMVRVYKTGLMKSTTKKSRISPSRESRIRPNPLESDSEITMPFNYSRMEFIPQEQNKNKSYKTTVDIRGMNIIFAPTITFLFINPLPKRKQSTI